MQNFDVVIPQNNEKELIDMAVQLGLSGLVFLSTDINYICSVTDNPIEIRKAYILKDVSEVNKARKRFDMVFAYAERRFFESGADYIIRAELSDRKDSFHYRNTSLNQVHAKLAKHNKISIVFNFDILLNSDFKSKQFFLGRMMQNAVLVKKYKLGRESFSLAKRPEQMRSRTILDAFKKILCI